MKIITENEHRLQMESMGLICRTTDRQKKNGTIIWYDPKCDCLYGIYTSGYVRRITKRFYSPSPYQLNPIRKISITLDDGTTSKKYVRVLLSQQEQFNRIPHWIAHYRQHVEESQDIVRDKLKEYQQKIITAVGGYGTLGKIGIKGDPETKDIQCEGFFDIENGRDNLYDFRLVNEVIDCMSLFRMFLEYDNKFENDNWCEPVKGTRYFI